MKGQRLVFGYCATDKRRQTRCHCQPCSQSVTVTNIVAKPQPLPGNDMHEIHECVKQAATTLLLNITNTETSADIQRVEIDVIGVKNVTSARLGYPYATTSLRVKAPPVTRHVCKCPARYFILLLPSHISQVNECLTTSRFRDEPCQSTSPALTSRMLASETN